MRMRIATAQEMAVAVCVLLAALLGLYWNSSHVEGNPKEIKKTTCYSVYIIIFAYYDSPVVLHQIIIMQVDLCISDEAQTCVFELC